MGQDVPTLRELADNQRGLVARLQTRTPPSGDKDADYTKALVAAIDKLATLENLQVNVPELERTG